MFHLSYFSLISIHNLFVIIFLNKTIIPCTEKIFTVKLLRKSQHISMTFLTYSMYEEKRGRKLKVHLIKKCTVYRLLEELSHSLASLHVSSGGKERGELGVVVDFWRSLI